MSNVFANKSRADMQLPGPDGKILQLPAGHTISGVSNYYQRYIGKVRGFVQLEDDGTSWVDGVKGSGKIPYAMSLVIDPGSLFENNGINFPDTIMRGPASYCQITVSVGRVSVRINESSHSDFILEPGDTQSFDEDDLLIKKIQFSTPPDNGSPAIVDVIATGRPSH